jgi:fumarate reductase flavoprotein subunit
MAAWVVRAGAFREPDGAALDEAVARAEAPFRGRTGAGDLEAMRERLYAMMWDDAGIVRDAEGLVRAETALADLGSQLGAYVLPAAARDRAFNLAWHDWLNLASLVMASRAIVTSAQMRENSRGAHYRADFADPGDLARSTYTRVRQRGGVLACEAIPVRFTRVRPGELPTAV